MTLPSSPRILLCTRSHPYPPKGGAPLRNWQNLNALAQWGEVTLFSAFAGILTDPAVPGIHPWHHFDLTHFLNQPETARQFLRSWLHPEGYPVCDRLCPPPAAQQFRQLMADLQPDLVIFEELWLYPYAKIAREFVCKIILDNHNVEYLGTYYQDKIRQGPGLPDYLKTLIRPWQVKTIEQRFCRLADQVWVCSTKDAAVHRSFYKLKPQKINIIPNTIDTTPFINLHFADTAPPIPEPLNPLDSYILFPATFGYAANDQAAIDLIQRIYPLLCEKLPHKFKLLFVGRSPNYAMLEAAKANPDIVVIGEVDDMKPYYAAASLVIVPLRFGSGTRLKILEAFAAKKPVVSTPKGAEGLTVEDGKHLLIGQDSPGLVNAILRLVNEPCLAEQLTNAAWEFVQAHYSWSIAQTKIQTALQAFGSCSRS